MVTESRTKLTLEEKVNILREHGVDVIQWIESDVVNLIPLPIVLFEGNENEGFRAVRIMQEHNIYFNELQKLWMYEGQTEPYRESWVLVF